uniref:Uncharacterized protein n=1 Tax=Rhizophora mucronata TaxID=61149 RepID=A0A2P2N9D1_RHIMU
MILLSLKYKYNNSCSVFIANISVLMKSDV